jgi:hypothetical protein
LRKDFHHPLSSFAGDTEVMESDRTQIGADKHRCAQDLEESRNSRNQVNLLSHIHGSLLGLLLRQQAAPFVGILSKNPNEHQREYRLQDRAGFDSGSEIRGDFKVLGPPGLFMFREDMGSCNWLDHGLPGLSFSPSKGLEHLRGPDQEGGD